MTEEVNEMAGQEGTPQAMVETTDLPPDGAIQEAYAKLCENNGANNPVETEIDSSTVNNPPSQPVKISCHKCGQKLDLSTLEPFSHVACPACGSDLIVPRWFDNYLLEEIAGVGGMATVYRALDLALDREVAIKVLLPELAVQIDKSELFLHEARTAATINHYAVIPIYTCGIFQNQTYIVMQYMGGGSLEKILEQTQEPLPLLHVISWIRDIAMGLDNARQHGIVHHDIKPANIMLDMEAKAKVGDFGIAQVVSGKSNGTADEFSRGWVSPHYASPEKIRTGEEDYRGDIYSLGATFYHLVTGLTPYPNAELEELIQKRLSTEPMAPHLQRTDLPEQLSQLILAMMAMDPDQRPSYETIVAWLNQYINNPKAWSGETATTGQNTGSNGARRPERKRSGSSALDRLNAATASKKRSPGAVVTMVIMNIITVLLLLCGTMFALFKAKVFNDSSFFTCFPDFLQETVKIKEEDNKNVIVNNYLHDGRPDLALSNSDVLLQDQNPDIRYQAVLQNCFAVLLNAERGKKENYEEFLKNTLQSLETNATPYEQVRYEDHIVLIRHMAGELDIASLNRALHFEPGKDFNLKLKLAAFLLALHDTSLKTDDLLTYLEEVKKEAALFQAGATTWVYIAFNDRLVRWEEVLTKKAGKKNGIEPVFRKFIEKEQNWETEIDVYSSELLTELQEQKEMEQAKERQKERERKQEEKEKAKEEVTAKNLENSMRRHRDVYKMRPNLNSRTDNNFLVNREAQQRYLNLLVNSGNLSADDQISEQWRITQMQHFNDYLLKLESMKGLTGLTIRGKGNVKADVNFSAEGVEFILVDGQVRYGEDDVPKEFMNWTDFRQKHLRPLIRACIRKQLADLKAKGEEPSPELRKELARQHLLLAVIAYWYQSYNDMELSLKEALELSNNDTEIKELVIRHFLK